MTEDLHKARDKISRLLQNIDELHAADSETQLAIKRVERELREEREKNLRLEQDVERLRAVSREKERDVRRSGTLAALSDDGRGSRRGSSIGLRSEAGDVKLEVPARKSSLSKGFL
jgi:myosin heavy chain 9/10/11/14